MKSLIIVIPLFLFSTVVTAQWSEEELVDLVSKTERYFENGNDQAAYDNYEPVLHLLRINFGLYTNKQMPWLIELIGWNKAQYNFDQANDLARRTNWLIQRTSGNKLQFYRHLLYSQVTLIGEEKCFKRDEYLYISSSTQCNDQRMYRADSMTLAVKIQQHIIELATIDQKMELEILVKLAYYTADLVFALEGAQQIVTINDRVYINQNSMPQQYYFKTYQKIAREAEQELLL